MKRHRAKAYPPNSAMTTVMIMAAPASMTEFLKAR